MPAAASGALRAPASQDFSGGLNTLDQPYLLAPNEARDLSNVQGTTAGAIVKRAGLVTFASPSAAFSSLFPLESTSPVYLIGADSGAIYSVSTGGTITSLVSGLSNSRWEFVSAPVVSGQGPLYGMNGIDTPKQWTGTGAAANWTATDTGGTVPNGKYCLYANNQVFVSGVSTAPSRVYWSGLADPTAWNPANLNGSGFADFDPNDGQAITGIGRIGPYILVFKPRKSWILVDPATGQSRPLSRSIGCVAHRSIKEGTDGTYFLSEDRGVYVTNGSKLTPISDKIQPTLDAASTALRSQAAGGYFASHYYLSLSSGGVNNDMTLDFDERLGSWWKHSFGSNQFAIWHPVTGNGQLYSAKATSAIVDQCFAPGVTVDNGTAFQWVWRGSWQSPIYFRHKAYQTPWFRKNLRQLRVQGAGTVDVSYAKDFAAAETLKQANIFQGGTTGTFGGAGTTFGGSNLFGGAGSILNAKLHSFGVANAFSIVFSATSTTQDMVVLYMQLLTNRRDMVVS